MGFILIFYLLLNHILLYLLPFNLFKFIILLYLSLVKHGSYLFILFNLSPVTHRFYLFILFNLSPVMH